MGTQGMAEDRSRAGIEVVRSGVLGAVREMHVWTDRAAGWWPQGVDRPKDTPPVPASLQWDLWLGPAPERPYNPIYHPFKWRGWLDFGTGPLGDMGIHNAAMVYLGLSLGLPTSIEVLQRSDTHAETFPAWATLRYEFPARGAQPPVTMFWYDGIKRPSADLLGGHEPDKNGAILVGANGTLYSVDWTGAQWSLLPRAKFRDYQPPAPTLPRSGGKHHAEWVRACKGGPMSFCNFPDFASPLTEVMLLSCFAAKRNPRRPRPPHRPAHRVGRREPACPELSPSRALHPKGIPQRVGDLIPIVRGHQRCARPPRRLCSIFWYSSPSRSWISIVRCSAVRVRQKARTSNGHRLPRWARSFSHFSATWYPPTR